MANSTITITFNEDFIIGSTIDLIGYWQSNSGTTVHRGNTWVNTRVYNGQVTTGIPTAFPGERTAINYVQAFTLDYGSSFTIVRTGPNVVLITAKDIEWRTVAISAYKSVGVLADITYSYSNTTDIAFNIMSATFSNGSIPCQNISISVQTTSLATKILSPVSVNPNANNPFSFEWLRGQTINIVVENSSGVQASKTVVLPSLLNSSNFTYLINNSPSGAAVIVQNSNMVALAFQYSLDNIVWQTSNVFSGLAPGNYVMYIKDQFGCVVTKILNIDEFNINNPFFLISKSNSIRYAKRINFGISSNYKNDENTLSCEVDVPLAYTEIQQFQSADSITTQFKSNYDENDAVVIRADGSEVTIPVIKRSSNIGLKEKRDARKYNLGDGKTGIYFISGNIYDYNSNAVVSSYSLSGSLPFWAQAKKYVLINGGWFQIEEIIFDESKNAEVIVIEDNYSGQEINVIVGSIYNLFDYEIYEYTVDMGDFINENIRVRLNNTDNNFGPIVHLSEMINVKEKQEKTIEIKYKNTDNTDIFYGTGIEHKIRQQYQKISGFKEDTSENYKTDTNTVLLSAEIYEGDEFLLEPVTKEMMRKIVRALSHKIVYIDEIGYCKNGDIEVEGPLEQSNLYVVKAKMIKNGNVYNTNSASGNDHEIYNGESYEVLGLVNSGAGFMRI